MLSSQRNDIMYSYSQSLRLCLRLVAAAVLSALPHKYAGFGLDETWES